MEFPKKLFVTVCGSGEDEYFYSNPSEVAAIEATDDEQQADVAEYELVTIRKRKIESTVIDA